MARRPPSGLGEAARLKRVTAPGRGRAGAGGARRGGRHCLGGAWSGPPSAARGVPEPVRERRGRPGHQPLRSRRRLRAVLWKNPPGRAREGAGRERPHLSAAAAEEGGGGRGEAWRAGAAGGRTGPSPPWFGGGGRREAAGGERTPPLLRVPQGLNGAVNPVTRPQGLDARSSGSRSRRGEQRNLSGDWKSRVVFRLTGKPPWARQEVPRTRRGSAFSDNFFTQGVLHSLAQGSLSFGKACFV